MSSDTIHALEGLDARIQRLQERTLHLKILRDQGRKELSKRETEVELLEARFERQSKIAELFRALMDILVNDQVETLQKVVSTGLRTIFHDQNLSFEAEVSSKRNKVWIDLFIRSGDPSDSLSHRGSPLDSFGGGPSSVVSLILRLLTLMRLKRYPLLVLDEALGAVSDMYIDQTGQFLQNLVKSSGLDLLLITHKPQYADYADQCYRGSSISQDNRSQLKIFRKR